MSKQSLKLKMSINQRDNRMKLEKFVNHLGHTKIKEDYSYKQELLQRETNSYNIQHFNPEIYKTIK